MAKESAIEWCDATFNPWIGCTRVSPACDNCYAAVSTPARTRGIEWGQGRQRQRTASANWRQPGVIAWSAGAEPMTRVGKKAAGSLLDGHQHLAWPGPGGD